MRIKYMIWIAAVWVLLSAPALAEEFDQTKAVIMDMEFRDSILYHHETSIVYNYPPVYLVEPIYGLRIEVLTYSNESEEFPYHDPRPVYYSPGGFQYLENVSFDIIIPFVRDMRTVRISDGNGTGLIEVDVSNLLGEFCAQANDYCDSDCAEGADPDCELGITTSTAPPTTIPTTLPTTTTIEQGGGQDILGYLPYLIILIIAIVIIHRLRKRQKIAGIEQKKKKEEEDLREWVEEQLKNGEDPELLRRALKRQGASPAVVDEIMDGL